MRWLQAGVQLMSSCVLLLHGSNRVNGAERRGGIAGYHAPWGEAAQLA
jgi:hypothetical protein